MSFFHRFPLRPSWFWWGAVGLGVLWPTVGEAIPRAQHETISPIAQVDINRDRQIQPLDPPDLSPRSEPENFEKPPEMEAIPDAPGDEITIEPGEIAVNSWELRGSTIFKEGDFQGLITPFLGRKVSLNSLKQLSDRITLAYLQQGYLTSRATLLGESLATGHVVVWVVEGGLEDIVIQGNERLSDRYFQSRLALGGQTPLNTARLENQLRLLKFNPLLENLEASIQAGSGLGQSVLKIKVEEANPLVLHTQIDNGTAPSVGSEKLGATLTHRNVFGNGEQLSGDFTHTAQGGADSLGLTYGFPLNAREGMLQFRSSFNRNRAILPPFDRFDIGGRSQLHEVSFRQPFVRTPKKEWALSWGLTYQRGVTFLGSNGFEFNVGSVNGVSETTAFKFSQDYLRRDSQGAWFLRSQLSLGLDLFSPTINPHPIPDGRFFSSFWQMQRSQILHPNHTLMIQGDLQLTPHSLLPAQQFVIGGARSLRGYRQNVRSGDNGFRFSVEDRITVQRDESGRSSLQVIPFLDGGNVWNHGRNPNRQSNNSNFLLGTGIGVLWMPDRQFSLRLDGAIPLVGIRDRGTNIQDQGLYFQLNYFP